MSSIDYAILDAHAHPNTRVKSNDNETGLSSCFVVKALFATRAAWDGHEHGLFRSHDYV